MLLRILFLMAVSLSAFKCYLGYPVGTSPVTKSQATSSPVTQSKESPDAQPKLTTAYIDKGHFGKAKALYKSVLEHERSPLSSLAEDSAKDLNGLAVTSYLNGLTQSDPVKRDSSFKEAIDYYLQAQAIYEQQNKDEMNNWRLKCVLANKELAWRDLNKLPQIPFDRCDQKSAYLY